MVFRRRISSCRDFLRFSYDYSRRKAVRAVIKRDTIAESCTVACTISLVQLRRGWRYKIGTGIPWCGRQILEIANVRVSGDVGGIVAIAVEGGEQLENRGVV